MYVIVDYNGSPRLSTLNLKRYLCMSSFLEDQGLDKWKDYKKIGYTCEKVDVHITSSSNLVENNRKRR